MYPARQIINSLILLLAGVLFFSTVSPLIADVVIQSNVDVTATVGPQPRDYQLSAVTTYDPAISLIRQNTDLEYVITYGASSSAQFASQTTLTADWRSSDAMTDVPVLDYVTGSATKAYNNTAPVVDLTNRQITWTIPSLPVGTMNQTVKFDLKTNSNYRGDGEIRFTVKANMNNKYVTMDEQSVTKTYKYEANPVLTTITPTSTQTTTITQAPAQSSQTQLSFGNISFSQIIQDSATIRFTTSSPASQVTIRYGTAANNLSHVLALDGGQTTIQNIALENLLPAKTYYFQLTLSDGSQTVTSDIFSFQTAQISTPPISDNNVVILTSNGTVLVSDVKQKNQSSSAIALVTTDTPYEITYRVRNNIALRSIEAVMRQTTTENKLSRVLAASEYIVPMEEKEPQVYFARLRTDIPGNFDILVRMQDTKGNLIEEKVAAIKVMPLLSVLDEATKAPIEDARLFISYFNTRTNRFEPVTQTLFENVANPSYTGVDGRTKLLLPPGRYRINVSAFAYRQQTVTFTLGTKAHEDFPQVLLHKDQTNLLGYVQYYGNAISDLITNIAAAVESLSFSVRFFNLLATFILIITIIITFVFFSLRTRVYIRHLLPYFTHHVRTLTQKQPLGTFCATITDEQGRRIKDALISVLDDTTGELLTSIASNTVGICYLFNPKEHKNLKLLIIKQGYQPKTVAVESDIAETPNGLTIVLKKGQQPKHAVLANTWRFIEAIAGRFFEVSLFVSLVLELFFLSVYGFGKTLPFFALSFFNLILWIMYQKEKQDRKVFKKA